MLLQHLEDGHVMLMQMASSSSFPHHRRSLLAACCWQKLQSRANGNQRNTSTSLKHIYSILCVLVYHLLEIAEDQ